MSEDADMHVCVSDVVNCFKIRGSEGATGEVCVSDAVVCFGDNNPDDGSESARSKV